MDHPSLGTIIYGNLTVLPSPVGNGTGSLAVAGGLYVDGTLTVKGDTKINHETQEENAKLRQELADVSLRVKSLEELVNALWHSPGMPGYVMARSDFEERAEGFKEAQNPAPESLVEHSCLDIWEVVDTSEVSPVGEICPLATAEDPA